MLISIKLPSKTALIFMLSVFTLHTSVQAFSIGEQLSKAKNIILENPKAACCGAGLVWMIGWYFKLGHDYLQLRKLIDRKESYYQGLKKIDLARMDGLPVYQIIKRAGLDMDDASYAFDLVKGPDIVLLGEVLPAEPLSQEEADNLKNTLELLGLKDDFTANLEHLNYVAFRLGTAIGIMQRRIEIDEKSVDILAPLLQQANARFDELNLVHRAVRWYNYYKRNEAQIID